MDVKAIATRAALTTFTNEKGGGAVKISRLNLVDLAGSEKVAKAGTSGQRLVEGTNINKSLMTLGMVIMALAKQCKTGKKEHIPYRDSKLTRLLSSSLGGNACTAVMCAISPAERNYEESNGTLKFATFSASVINKVTVNVVADSGAMLKEYKGEIEELKLTAGKAEGRLKDIIDLLVRAKESQLVERDYNFAAKLIDMQMGVATGDLTLAEQIQEIEAIIEVKKQEDPHFFEGDPRPQRAQGGRKMSTMSMNNLARISQMHASLISDEERVQLQETIAEEDEEEEDVDELKEQVEDLTKKAEELEESLAERDAQIAKQASDAAQQERQLAELNKTVAELQGKNKAAEAQLKDAQQAALRAGQDSASQVAQLHKVETQLKDAMKANEQLVADRDRTLSEGEKLRRQIEDLVRQNEIQRGKNAEELERLQTELGDSHKHAREITSSADRKVQEERDKMLRDAAQFKALVAEFDSFKKSAREEKEKLQVLLSEMIEEHIKMTTENTKTLQDWSSKQSAA